MFFLVTFFNKQTSDEGGSRSTVENEYTTNKKQRCRGRRQPALLNHSQKQRNLLFKFAPVDNKIQKAVFQHKFGRLEAFR